VQRRITGLAKLGLAVQLQLVVLVLMSAVLVAGDSGRALTLRATEDAAADLLTGMADQQTGLLTYLKLAQPDSLLLYGVGQAQVGSALARLRSGTRGTADSAAEARVESAVRDWERWAEGQHMLQQPITEPAVAAAGRALFDRFAAARRDLSASLVVASQRAEDRIRLTTAVSVVVVSSDALAVTAMAGVFSLQVVRQVLTPLKGLATAAEEVAEEGMASIPYRDRVDEVGELARALQGWQEAAAVRTILAEQAPVGICRIGADGRLLSTNKALEKMLGYTGAELVGRELRGFLHPDDRSGTDRADGSACPDAGDGESEHRWLRSDGSLVWCSMVTTPVPGPAGQPHTVVGIMEDITERKRHAQRAAQIQRDLLPGDPPRLEGYEVAAGHRALRDVTGNFYDWTQPDTGHFDLTVADVTSGGAAAALVMATLRMALRTMPPELGPATRVGLVADSMGRALRDNGLAVALFHGRLDLASGVFHYVDADSCHAAIRRASGELAPLPGGAPPLGSVAGERYEESRVGLAPGDVLFVYTAGLVAVEGGTVALEELLARLEGAGDAADAVGRLLDAVGSGQRDDATVVVVRRAGLPE
jgi:PAS domain S-box-containing protein